MAFKDQWKDKVDNEDDVLAEHINSIAQEAIRLENDKENSANKTTELSENSTDEQYPSAKAVVGYVGEKAQEAAKATNSIAEKLGGLTFSVSEDGILTISKED